MPELLPQQYFFFLLAASIFPFYGKSIFMVMCWMLVRLIYICHLSWSATFSFDGLWMAQAQAVYVNPGITLSVPLSSLRINFTSSQPKTKRDEKKNDCFSCWCCHGFNLGPVLCIFFLFFFFFPFIAHAVAHTIIWRNIFFLSPNGKMVLG